MAKLPRIKRQIAIVDSEGRPENAFVLFWQRFCEANEAIDTLQQQQIDDILAAQTTADGVAAALAAHIAAPDPHPQYLTASEVASRAKQRFLS